MVFITGPRQVGKTFLAKQLQKKFKSAVYLNYDDIDDQQTIKKRVWEPENDLIIFDEIHKLKGWKNYLKGTFDTRPENQRLLITGSARLDAFRQTGESLAGRYFHYRLNPLSVKEAALINISPRDALIRLNRLGGFPEPFLADNDQDARRWRDQYYTDLVREDIFDFGRIHEIKTIRTLLELLRKRVGSPLSYKALSEDLQVAPNTVKKYVSILESLYIIFLIRPFHKNIARSILREPKVYFYDTGYINMDDSFRLENTVGLSLLKHVMFLKDTQGENISLNYLRTKSGREVDFAIVKNNQLTQCIEVKLSDYSLSPNLKYFTKFSLKSKS